MTTAVVVGSGPNGLAAAVTLARFGVEVTVLEAAETIGGGTRTSERTLPGLLHDHCSAVHPLGIGSPFLSSLDLARYGVTWRWPEVDLAHPLDGGNAGVLLHSLQATAALLGPDNNRWRRLFGPLSTGFDDLAQDVLRPIGHLPAHPLRLAMFGMNALAPATWTNLRWQTDGARALFAGVAAHSLHPLNRPLTSAVGLLLIALAHRHGWPVAEGGSRAISDALARLLTEEGGSIETGVRVRSLADLPPTDIVMLDVAPQDAAAIAGSRLPARVRRAYLRYRHGPAAYKLDLAVQGGIPWTNEHCRRAGTVHVGGTAAEIADAEQEINNGRMPRRPFVLVGQQYLADPSRSVGQVHPVWVYGHVPSGYTGSAEAAILDQIERFAPGTRERIVACSRTTPTDWTQYNPNYVAGDIATGATTARQVAFRPRMTPNPYRTGIPGVLLCSAATPPGAGVHGMCGYNAARSALTDFLPRHLHPTPVPTPHTWSKR
jgi:phytoene dehydrogenase-like protein